MYKQTIGVDFYTKIVTLPGDVAVTLQLWNIGGQSIGSNMIQHYIFGSDAVIMVYDITNYDSFQNLEDWYRLVTKTFDKDSVPYCALVGNKSEHRPPVVARTLLRLNDFHLFRRPAAHACCQTGEA